MQLDSYFKRLLGSRFLRIGLYSIGLVGLTVAVLALLLQFGLKNNPQIEPHGSPSGTALKTGPQGEMVKSIDHLASVVAELSARMDSISVSQRDLEKKFVSLELQDNQVIEEERTMQRLSPEEAQLQFEQARNELRQRFDQRVEADTDNSAVWSVEREQQFKTLFDTDPVLAKASSFSTKCSNSVCRVEYTVSKDLDFMERELLDMTLSTKLGKSIAGGTIYTEETASGETRHIHYLSQNTAQSVYDASSNQAEGEQNTP